MTRMLALGSTQGTAAVPRVGGAQEFVSLSFACVGRLTLHSVKALTWALECSGDWDELEQQLGAPETGHLSCALCSFLL